MSRVFLVFLAAVVVAAAQESIENSEGESVRHPRGIFGRESGRPSLPVAMFTAAANTASAFSGIGKGSRDSNRNKGSNGDSENAEAHGYYELVEVNPGHDGVLQGGQPAGGSKGESNEDSRSSGSSESRDYYERVYNGGGSWSGNSGGSSADKKEPSISSRIVGQSLRVLGEGEQSMIAGPSYGLDSGKAHQASFHYGRAPVNYGPVPVNYGPAPVNHGQASVQYAPGPHRVQQHAQLPIYNHAPVNNAPSCGKCVPSCGHCASCSVNCAQSSCNQNYEPQIEYVHIEHPSKIHETVVEHIIEHPPQIIEKTKHVIERVPHIVTAHQTNQSNQKLLKKPGKKW